MRIAEPDDVNSVGSIRSVDAGFPLAQLREVAAGIPASDVVHEVMAEGSARATEGISLGRG
jgi:hypothetical protein